MWQRIGRLKTKHSRVASHYQIAVTADETGEKAVAVTWTRRPRDGSMATHPGVYCLRSLRLAGRDEKIHENVCRCGDCLPIHEIWRARRVTGTIRTSLGVGETLATCASNA